MKATTLIVEYLVGGILLLSGLAMLYWSFFPEGAAQAVETASAHRDIFLSLPFTAVLVGIVYGLGIVAESLGRHCFEWILHKKSVTKLSKFLKHHSSWIFKDQLLSSLSSERLTSQKARSIYGAMRFAVLSHDERLYSEISSQVNRMRVIRILALWELMLMIAILHWIFRDFGWALLFSAVVLGMLFITTILAITSRFDRYFRSIERGYRVIANKGFNRTPESSGAAKPGELGAGPG